MRSSCGIAAVVAALAFSCVSAVAADKVRVAVTAGLADAPVIVATERGYFAKEDIEIEPVVFASAAQAIAPLASKELDVAGGAISAALYNAVERGINIKAVADRSHTAAGIPYITIFVRKDLVDSGRFKTLADLKGMKFAMIARGIAVHSLLEAGLRSANLTMSDVDIIYLDYPQQVAALKTGALDATLMGEPYATDLVDSGVGVRVMNTNDFFPNYVVTVFLYGETMLKDRPQVGLRFMKALMRGVRDYNDALDDKGLLTRAAPDMIKAFEREFKMSPEAMRRVYSHSVDPNGQINTKSVEIDYAWLKDNKIISGKVEPAQLMDTSFAEKAAAELGPYVRK